MHKCVRENVEALIVDLQKHPYDREYYYQIRNSDRTSEYANWTDIQRASRFIYLNTTCFNGLYRVNSKGEYNVPFGKYKNPKIVAPENLRACSQALQDTEILADSFLSVVSIIVNFWILSGNILFKSPICHNYLENFRTMSS